MLPRLILRSRNVLAIYEMPSSNEDQRSLDINTDAVERSEAARARRLAGVTVNWYPPISVPPVPYH